MPEEYAKSYSNDQNIVQFHFGEFDFVCPKIYLQFLEEVLILDVYRSNLLKKDYTVVDLGASTGDFCIIASKKVGKNGIVIAVEPNPRDYTLLLRNIEINRCENIIPVNVGVGNRKKMATTSFRGQSFRFCVETLEDILANLRFSRKIDFIKMDIEGYEAQVIEKSLEKIKDARVISLEFHGTKQLIDKILNPLGFVFEPITMKYIYKRILKNLIFHPVPSMHAVADAISRSPSLIGKTITGFDVTNTFLNGSYIRYPL